MNNRYINSVGLSGIAALIGFGICMLNYDITADTPEGCVLWAAELFAVCLVMGVLGMEAELFMRKKRFVAVGRKSIAVSLGLALIAGLLIGGAGQALFALENEKYISESDEDVEYENTHVVFIMDYSGSMGYYIDDGVDVTCQLLDGLDKGTSFQFIAFSDTVENRAVSDFLPVTDSNRTKLQDFIRGVDIFPGGTNFDLPLERAYQTLTQNREEDCRSLIVMLSDYEKNGYSFATRIGDKIKDEDIEIYSVRITDQNNQTLDQNDPFMKYVDKDFPVLRASDGSIDTDELLSAIRESVTGSETVEKEKNRLALSEELVTASEDTSWWRIILRAAVYGLFSMTAGYIYYGYESMGRLLTNFAPGVLAAAVSVINPLAGFIVLLMAGLGSFTKFEITGGRQNVR